MPILDNDTYKTVRKKAKEAVTTFSQPQVLWKSKAHSQLMSDLSSHANSISREADILSWLPKVIG